jgi:hypothetical protein
VVSASGGVNWNVDIEESNLMQLSQSFQALQSAVDATYTDLFYSILFLFFIKWFRFHTRL